MKTGRRMFGVCLPMLLCTVGCSGGDECDTGSYPDPPEGATGLVHVSAGCPSEGADGSAAHPYPTISQGISAATAGSSVLVRGATYQENITIDKPISVVGPTGGDRGEMAGIILQAPAVNAVTLVGADGARIRGLRVDGATRAGVVMRGSSATIEDSWIGDIAADPENASLGYGIAASENSFLTLQHSSVINAATLGVFLYQSHGIILQNNVNDHLGGGIRVDGAAEETRIEGNTIANDVGYGIALFSASGIILQNVIRDVRVGEGDSGTSAIAYGIVTAGTSPDAGGNVASLKAYDNQISGAARVGVLCAADTRTIILQNNTMEASALTTDFGAGIWLQGGAGGDAMNVIASNIVQGNRYVGIGLRGETHGIILQDNTVQGTLRGTTFVDAVSIEVGDGIGLMRNASAQITGNRVLGNARIGIVLDTAGAGTRTDQNIIQDNQVGLLLQNQRGEPDLGNDQIQGNATDTQTVPFGTTAFPVRDDEFATKLSR